METLKYTVIKNDDQYDHYCELLESLTDLSTIDDNTQDEIELLTVLIERYDEEHSPANRIDPITLLKSFMEDHKITATALAAFLEVSKGYVSDILHYKKGLSKEVIRKLAERFKVRQDLFNRPYPLHPGTPKNLITDNS